MRWGRGISDRFQPVVLREVMRVLLRDVRNLRLGHFFSKQPVNKFRGSPRVTCAVRALLGAVAVWEGWKIPVAPIILGRQKSCGQLLGESWPRAIRSGTGRGGDVTGARNSMIVAYSKSASQYSCSDLVQ